MQRGRGTQRAAHADHAAGACLSPCARAWQPATKPIKHPCLPHGAKLEHKGHELVGDGDWHKCKRVQRQLFSTGECPYASCSFGGAYQPSLPSTFYGFSYLYDRTAAIGLLDHKMQPVSYTHLTLPTKA